MGWRYGFIVSTCGRGACTLRYLFNLVLEEEKRGKKLDCFFW